MLITYDHIQMFKIRKALSLTQAEFGALLGMSAVNVHYIEKGEQRLSEHYKDKLRNELGIDAKRAAELIIDYDEMNSLAGDKARALRKMKLGGE